MPDEPNRNEIDNEILRVMERTLHLDSPACQESALHGLGHWMPQYPGRVQEIVDKFLAVRSGLRKELREYAQSARMGCVL
jgi:hypothetical protein